MNQLTGLAGEHWVCSMLARHGWAVSLTRDGMERTDILGVKAIGGERRVIEVQVKTASDRGADLDTSLRLGKHGSDVARSKHEWFALVLMPSPAKALSPRTFIVPRDHVNAARAITYGQWRFDPEHEGKRTTTLTSALTRLWPFADYEGAWELLDLETPQVDVRLDSRLQEWLQLDYVHLPDGHPWQKSKTPWALPALS
ncbi:hypothetical protein GCM10025783_30260 [Amnibacterium soli]|uniref:Uncharacterized protein n=1 Tax=Amnibacterium soli TaxID=1282736 RepID=A0ABP8ZFJ9_9MICO